MKFALCFQNEGKSQPGGGVILWACFGRMNKRILTATVATELLILVLKVHIKSPVTLD